MEKKKGSTHPILKTLFNNSIINEDGVKNILRAFGTSDQHIMLSVFKNSEVDENTLLDFLSTRYGIPYINLDCVNFDLASIDILEQKQMLDNLVVPLSKIKDTLYLAVADPTDMSVIDDIKFRTGLTVSPVIASALKIHSAASKMGKSMQGQMEAIFGISDDAVASDADEVDLDADDANSDSAVIRMVQHILTDAIARGVSDIHIEPFEKETRVRYRQDGVLVNVVSIQVGVREALTSRLKILCRLDIAEKRLPQDGRMRIRLADNKYIDFRASFLPTAFGETIVLRILDPSSSKVPIESLGFLPEQRVLFEKAIASPYGMILVTGPTGSGKTTTLYTALNILNDGEINISTVEDPIEIPVFGINQVQVNDKVGLTFAAALRSLLRQDPDVLMVGEIRDLETAETAVKAAQTGHLVLATLHTNDAPQTLTRMENMGIPTYNIASAVLLVMAQRLGRKLCPDCKKPVNIPDQALVSAGYSEKDLIGWKPYGPVGCDACNNTGYKGRIGFYQVMPVSNAMKSIILRGGTALDIEKQARDEGVLDMRGSGLVRVCEGLTSLDEVLRITTRSE